MNEHDEKIIQGIQAEVYDKYKDKLWKKEEKAPTMKKVAHKALNEEHDNLTPAQRDEVRKALDSGELDGEKQVIDEEVGRQMENEVKRKMYVEIKKGNLSDPSTYDRGNTKQTKEN